LIRREATKVSGQEIETQKSSNNARSVVGTVKGASTNRVRKRVPESRSDCAEDKCNISI